MKLLRLKLNADFGSLKENFQINFRPPFIEKEAKEIDWDEFSPFCFAGLNGSGKSNVLEALANIFYHLESCVNIKQPENFKTFFDGRYSSPDAYELEYYIVPSIGVPYELQNTVRVLIIKKIEELPQLSYTPYPFTDTEQIPVTVLANKESNFPAEAKKYLPDLVIGYSSGENEILSIPFLKTRLIHYDEYLEALQKNYRYSEPESNLIYIDYEMSQAVLLSNFLFQGKDALKPLNEHLGIIDITRFRMNLNLHAVGKHRILDQFFDTINAFKNCATAIFETDNKLLLDFWINDDTKDAFRKNFDGDIFKLFRAFQVLYTLNYRTIPSSIKSDVYQSKGFYTDGKVPVPSPEDNVFYFLDYRIKKLKRETNEVSNLLLKNLSDGEQQFLHSMGICLMLKNRSALLLLDEPETHFNPDWRSKFISTIKGSLIAAGNNNLMMDLLITSHSPFIVSDCKREKVFVFEGKSVSNPKINTFGTSVNIITEEVFKKKESISDLPIKQIADIKALPLDTLEGIEQAKNASRVLGESVEKVLLFRELLLKEKELRNNDTKL